MKSIIGFFAICGYIIWACLVHGYVLTKLWLWFVVPQFSVKPLTMTIAIGLLVITRFIVLDDTPEDKKEHDWDALIKKAFAYSVTIPACFLLVGYIVKSL